MSIAPEPSDKELCAGLRRGDARAFDLVYARYRARIYSFLLRLAGSRDVADDLFQETFMQLARHAKTLREDTDLPAFLYTVARNRYRSHRRRSLFRLDRLRELALHRGAGAHSGTPFEAAAARHTARGLEAGLLLLSPPLREALLLVVVEGLEGDAAARVLGIEPATLRQRLSRAREKLGEHLAKSHGEGGKHGA